MADTSVIKEYLVKLGFQVDEKGLKRFTGEVENAGKAVFKFVTAIQGAALSIGAGVAAFASNLESLYYASQRTNTSASNLRAFGAAAQNFGASAQSALATVEGLAAFMRENPAGESFMRGFGVQTRDVNGQLKDTPELLAAIGDELAKKPYYLAKIYADQLRINEDTMRSIMDPKFRQELTEQRKRYENSGLEKATRDAKEFMTQLREMRIYLEQFALRVQEALMNRLGMSLEEFSKWFQVNGPMIADRVADILLIFLKFAEVVGPALTWIVEKIIEVDTATDGLSTKVLGVLAVLKMLGGFAVIGAIMKLAGAFVTLGGAMAGASKAGLLLKAGVAGVAAYGGLKLAEAAGLPNVDTDKGKEALRNGDWLAASAYLSASDFLGAVYDNAMGRDPLAAFENKPKQEPSAAPQAPAQSKATPPTDQSPKAGQNAPMASQPAAPNITVNAPTQVESPNVSVRFPDQVEVPKPPQKQSIITESVKETIARVQREVSITAEKVNLVTRLPSAAQSAVPQVNTTVNVPPPTVINKGGQDVTVNTPAPKSPTVNLNVATQGDKSLPRGIRNNNPGNLNFAGQAGAVKEGGASGRFAVFKSAEDGLAALARQLRLYAKRGLDTVQEIIATYAPASENNTKAYVDKVTKALGVGANQTLDLGNSETLKKLMDSIIKMENGFNPYSANQLQAATAAGGRNVQVSQTTNINVTGATNAGEAARQVVSAQERVNSDMVRNMQTAVK